MCADNERIYLNAEETRKIILICLIFYRTKNITFPCETINLEYILSAIKMNDLNIFELSFNDNLQTLELAGALNELSHIDQEPDYFGYKLHALCGLSGVIHSYDLSKASVADLHYMKDKIHPG